MTYYDKLRPWSDIQYCECNDVKSVLLVYTLNENPIHCYECKGAIDPETLSLSEAQVSKVGKWLSDFKSLYHLWLNSGEYEEYAKEKLLDKDGQVNIAGMAAAKLISEVKPTYYWWFHETIEPSLEECPNCGGELDGDTRHGDSGKCQVCFLVV